MAERTKTYVKQYDLYMKLIGINGITIYGVLVLCKTVQFQELGQYCFISNKSFSEFYGISESTIKRQINILVENELLLKKSFFKKSLTGKTRLLSVPHDLDSKVRSLVNLHSKKDLEEIENDNNNGNNDSNSDINNSDNDSKNDIDLGSHRPLVKGRPWVIDNQTLGHSDPIIYNRGINKNNKINKYNITLDPNFLPCKKDNLNKDLNNDSNEDTTEEIREQIREQIKKGKQKYEYSNNDYDDERTTSMRINDIREFWNNLNLLRKYYYIANNSKDTAMYIAWTDKDNKENYIQYSDKELEEYFKDIDMSIDEVKKLIEDK